jgi:hypothetical protein
MLVAMADVEIGSGSLGGRGIYAARRFAEGELVISFDLRRLSREEYLSLPEGEHLFVHSYWGDRWLYPEPARYVNHADDPNTFPDFERHGDIAARPIEPGELITIDARVETDHELATFLRAYETAVNEGDQRKLECLIDRDAVAWIDRAGCVDKPGILRLLIDVPRRGLRLEVGHPHWIIGTGRWDAVASYDYEIRAAGGSHTTGRATDVLKVIDGNWQLVYRHESAS